MAEDTTIRWDSRIEHRNLDGAICVRFHDRKIVSVDQIEAISDELTRLSAAEGSRLILNLEGVDFLSSAALNKLVSLERRIRKGAGQFALCALTTTVRDVMSITRLNTVFAIHETESAALAAFH